MECTMQHAEPQPIAPLSYVTGATDRSLPVSLNPGVLAGCRDEEERDWRAEELVDRLFDVLAMDAERCLEEVTSAAGRELASRMTERATASDREVAAIDAFLADIGVSVEPTASILAEVEELSWYSAAETALDALLETLVVQRRASIAPDMWAKQCLDATDQVAFTFSSGLDASASAMALDVTAECAAAWLSKNGRQDLMYRNRFVQLSVEQDEVRLGSYVPGLVTVDAEDADGALGRVDAIPVGPVVLAELEQNLATFRLGVAWPDERFVRFETSTGPTLCGQSRIALGEFGPPSHAGVVPWSTSAGTLWQWEVPDEAPSLSATFVGSDSGPDPTIDMQQALRFVSIQPEYGDPAM
jgi:hypothetical protein